jgi:hypothetical protein
MVFLRLIIVILTIFLNVGCINQSNKSGSKAKTTPAVVAEEDFTINSTLSLSSTSVQSNGVIEATLITKNILGVQVYNPDLNIEIYHDEGTSTFLNIGEENLNNGVYHFQLKGIKAGTPTKILLKINGVTITQAAPELTVSVGSLSKVKIEDKSDGTGVEVGSLTLVNGVKKNLFLIGRDINDNFIANLNAEEWSLSSQTTSYLTQTNGASTQVVPHKSEGNFLVNVIYHNGDELFYDTTGVLSVNYDFDFNQLVRWYKADSLNTSLVENSSVTTVEDFGEEGVSYNANESSATSKPQFKNNYLEDNSALKFCNLGAGLGCLDTTHDRLKIANSYNDFALKNSDFTVIIVTGRGNSNANHLISSNSTTAGLFMGWTNNTNFKIGVDGVSGAQAMNVTVSGFSEEKWEIWTAKLDTEIGSLTPGLSLFKNGVLVGLNSGFTAKITATTQIPYLGYTTSKLAIGEVMIYNKALNEEEIIKIETYLKQKYKIL